MNVTVLEIGTQVFVNRGSDIIQRGRVSGHIVTTQEASRSSGDPTIEVQVSYVLEFPHSRFSEDTFPAKQTLSQYDVYMTLEDAFNKKC